MSKRSRSPEAEVEMNLNLNLNRSPAWSSTEESVSSAIVRGSSWLSSSSSSSDISCEGEDHGGHVRYSSSDHEIITRSMALVGCPGCFMYVMLTDKSSQCPKCKNSVFLDFFKHHGHQHGCKN